MRDKPRITAFYEPMGGFPEEEWKLIELWKDAWRKAGWQPHIMRLVDCLLHPKFIPLLAKANTLPNTGHELYHRICILRWLAFSHVGGVLADYDVFPKGPVPQFPDHISTNCNADIHPGFVVAPKSWCERFVDEIISYRVPEDKTGTVCDQEIMMTTPNLFDQVHDLCRIFGEPSWKEKPLVHFAIGSLAHRHQAVKYLMEL